MNITPKATLPAGFLAAGVTAGLKASGAPDMAMIFSESPAVMAATFTTNQVKAAPVKLGMDRLKRIGMAHGIVINSGQANACSGVRGLKDAEEMAQAAADWMGVARETFLVCSTGRIGVPLKMDIILPGIEKLSRSLSAKGGETAATAIMTTDTRPKRFTATFIVDGKPCRMTGLAKGAGMIEPCMATMLAFIMTDAAVKPAALQKALTEAVRHSFNRISVDGDRSTNDTCYLLANGRAANSPLNPKHPDWPAFVEALQGICLKLAHAMVKDGEGAKKFITVNVKGAKSAADADAAARAVANSLLVKTSWAGSFPNWGRIMDAIGYSTAKVSEDKVDIWYDKRCAVRNGISAGTATEKLAAIISKPEFSITIDLHVGSHDAVLYTCECTEEYVRINMD